VALPHRRAEAALAAHIAAGLATAPRQRWQHGQERAADRIGRAPHQVASGVDVLYQAKAIDDAAVYACDRFRLDYVCGVLGVHDGGRSVGKGSPDWHVIQLARARAVTAHRAAADLLGAELTYLLVTFLVDDCSFAELARRFGRDGSNGRAMMRGRLEVIVAILPGLYRTLDRAQRKGPRGRRDDLRSAAAGE
jgi:hypothetical protein